MNEEYYGPIWIDPRCFQQYVVGGWWGKRTVTTTGSGTQPVVQPAPVDEEQIRKIVREEMADLVKPDVPEAPPEDWS